jgi:hypothetical protein
MVHLGRRRFRLATVQAVPRSPHVAKLIRFPPEIYDGIEANAQEERRSITSMVVRLVEEAIEARRRSKREGQAPPA